MYFHNGQISLFLSWSWNWSKKGGVSIHCALFYFGDGDIFMWNFQDDFENHEKNLAEIAAIGSQLIELSQVHTQIFYKVMLFRLLCVCFVCFFQFAWFWFIFRLLIYKVFMILPWLMLFDKREIFIPWVYYCVKIRHLEMVGNFCLN